MIDLLKIKELFLNKEPFLFFGCDEVGRGPLAGPVVAASIAIYSNSYGEVKDVLDSFSLLGITDSKKLKAKKRENILKDLNIDCKNISTDNLFKIKLLKNTTLIYAVSEVSNDLIDKLNILNASLEAMKNSINIILEFGKLKKVENVFGFIDGINSPDINCEFKALAKADSQSTVVALASIVAKEYRDRIMRAYASLYPYYGLEKNAGYPTKYHKEAIVKYGVTAIHRRSFKGV